MSSGRFKCIEQGKTVLEGGFEWTDDIDGFIAMILMLHDMNMIQILSGTS